MQKQKSFVFLFVIAASVHLVPLVTGPTYADTTVTLEQPVHFTTAEGGDVVLDSGSYAMEAAEGWLRMTPSEGQAVGSYSGVRSRAGSSLLTPEWIRNLMALAQSTPPPGFVPEWSTLFFGGRGGVRNFNLGCGSSGIMTGALARWGSWLHELTILCRQVNLRTANSAMNFL